MPALCVSTVEGMRKSVPDRILDQIALHSGVTSTGLLASDLRLALSTVKRHIDRFIAEGRVSLGWDGRALELSDAEIAERAVDARVRSHR